MACMNLFQGEAPTVQELAQWQKKQTLQDAEQGISYVGKHARLMQVTKQGNSGAVYMAQWNRLAVGGPLNGMVFPVFGAMRMGCGNDVAIRFPENTLGISDVHCEVINTGNGLVVRDLESAYGTYMSIQKLEPFADSPTCLL